MSSSRLQWNVGLQLNMHIGPIGHSRFSRSGIHSWSASAFAGASYQSGFATPALNLSATYYSGTVGTSPQSPDLWTLVASPSLTLGWLEGKRRPLNTFNHFSGTGVYTNFQHSISLGQNLIFSPQRNSDHSRRHQRNSYFGLTLWDTFSAGHYNDVEKGPFWWGDRHDRFWSAGLNAHVDFQGCSASYVNDMYYGMNNNKDTYAQDTIKEDGRNYATQKPYDENLNNAVEYLSLRCSNLYGNRHNLGIGRFGRAAMWPSNLMHDSIPDKYIPGKTFHRLWVNYPTTTLHTLGLEFENGGYE